MEAIINKINEEAQLLEDELSHVSKQRARNSSACPNSKIMKTRNRFDRILNASSSEILANVVNDSNSHRLARAYASYRLAVRAGDNSQKALLSAYEIEHEIMGSPKLVYEQ